MCGKWEWNFLNQKVIPVSPGLNQRFHLFSLPLVSLTFFLTIFSNLNFEITKTLCQIGVASKHLHGLQFWLFLAYIYKLVEMKWTGILFIPSNSSMWFDFRCDQWLPTNLMLILSWRPRMYFIILRFKKSPIDLRSVFNFYEVSFFFLTQKFCHLAFPAYQEWVVHKYYSWLA